MTESTTKKSVSKVLYCTLLIISLLEALYLSFLSVYLPRVYPIEGPLNVLCWYVPTVGILLLLLAVNIVCLVKQKKAHSMPSFKKPPVLLLLIVCAGSILFLLAFNIFSLVRGPLGYVPKAEKAFARAFSFQEELNRENLSPMFVSQIYQWGNTTFVDAFCMEEEMYAQAVPGEKTSDDEAAYLEVTYLKNPPKLFRSYYRDLFGAYYETAVSELPAEGKLQKDAFEQNGIDFMVCCAENEKGTETLVLFAKTEKLLLLYKLRETDSIDRALTGYAVETVEKACAGLE